MSNLNISLRIDQPTTDGASPTVMVDFGDLVLRNEVGGVNRLIDGSKIVEMKVDQVSELKSILSKIKNDIESLKEGQ